MGAYINHRERFMNTLTFKPVDRIPLIEWGVRGATMREWLKQGYPRGVSTQDFFGLDPCNLGVPINIEMLPRFEPRIIEQNSLYKVWVDELGATRKDFAVIENEGFVTRSWISFAVKNRADFLEMQKRYNPADPARVPENFALRCDILNGAGVNNHLSIPFLFWVARDWIGFENLCMMFYDDPSLVEEIFAFLTDFCIETLRDKLKYIAVDLVEFKEDMAYKHAPMISPEMFRKFMLPHYKRIIGFLKSNGAKLVYVDCDGDPGGLIPLWIEAGVDAVSPCEIAAGNDLLNLRKEYPRLALFGGVDKRELAKDKKAIYDEVVPKIPMMIERGGFIPHIDHAIPQDVPLRNYMYYRELLTAVAYGEPLGALAKF